MFTDPKRPANMARFIFVNPGLVTSSQTAGHRQRRCRHPAPRPAATRRLSDLAGEPPARNVKPRRTYATTRHHPLAGDLTRTNASLHLPAIRATGAGSDSLSDRAWSELQAEVAGDDLRYLGAAAADLRTALKSVITLCPPRQSLPCFRDDCRGIWRAACPPDAETGSVIWRASPL